MGDYLANLRAAALMRGRPSAAAQPAEAGAQLPSAVCPQKASLRFGQVSSGQKRQFS